MYVYIYICVCVYVPLSVYCHVMFGGCIAGRLVPQPMHRSRVHRWGAEPVAVTGLNPPNYMVVS